MWMGRAGVRRVLTPASLHGIVRVAAIFAQPCPRPSPRLPTLPPQERPLCDRLSKTQLLAPLLGAMLALWRADGEGQRPSSPLPPPVVLAAVPPTKLQRSSASVVAAEEATAGGSAEKGAEKRRADLGEEEEGEEEEGPLPHTSFVEALADVADERVQVRGGP